MRVHVCSGAPCDRSSASNHLHFVACPPSPTPAPHGGRLGGTLERDAARPMDDKRVRYLKAPGRAFQGGHQHRPNSGVSERDRVALDAYANLPTEARTDGGARGARISGAHRALRRDARCRSPPPSRPRPDTRAGRCRLQRRAPPGCRRACCPTCPAVSSGWARRARS
eukprot:2882266-Prymnesium_polylepis.2